MRKPKRAETGGASGHPTPVIATGAALLLFANPATALCHDNWLCIDEVTNGDTIELQARNLRNVPLTFTLEVDTAEHATGGARSVTRTLRPQQTDNALQLQAADGWRPGRYRVHLAWTIGDKDANHDDDHLYALPYASGRSYRILQGFGSSFSHTGLEQFAVDFDMPVGTPVHAARGGIVAHVEERHERGCWRGGCGQYANFIVILHNDGTTGEYYHLMKDGAVVEVGDSVARGQLIGYSGNTGNSALPHLHFAVYRASSNGETQSVPIRFQGADGIVRRPRSGGQYRAAH